MVRNVKIVYVLVETEIATERRVNKKSNLLLLSRHRK